MTTWRVVFVSVLLLVSLCVVPVGATAAGQQAQPAQYAAGDELTLTTTLDRTPEEIGTITATLVVDIPDQFTELELELPPEARVTETVGFQPTDDGTVVWNERGSTATVTYQVAANKTVERDRPEIDAHRLPENDSAHQDGTATDGQFRFAETESWALIEVPRVGDISGRIVGDEPAIVRHTEIDGPGVAGDNIAFLGSYEEQTNHAHGQTFRLIVPDSTALGPEPDEIFRSLSHAADRLRVGNPDDEVFMIAAPTGEVEWAVRGLQVGERDFWVRDDEALDTAANNWVHEYVHTRQKYQADDDFQWFTEATATYYAALLTLEEDRIDFARFQRFLETGTAEPQASAVLSEPTSWENFADYRKGALVTGEIDREIREATGGEASLETVFRAVNSHPEPIDAQTFEAAVKNTAGDGVAASANQYTTTESVPEVWEGAAHASAFGQQPAQFSYRFAAENPITIGDRTVSADHDNLTVQQGEQMTVRITVENVGETVGSYKLPFGVGETEETRAGQLQAGETRTHEFTHQFTEPGTYQVTAGDETIQVTVESGGVELPADVDVPTDVEVPGFGVAAAAVAILLATLAARVAD